MPSPEEVRLLSAIQAAATLGQRTDAVEAAVRGGVPLTRIEEYLDWLDAHVLAVDDRDGAKDPPSAL